jgi:hypothetical protein
MLKHSNSYKQSIQLPIPSPAKQDEHTAQPTPGAAQVAAQAATALAQPIFFHLEHPDAITVLVKFIAILVLLTLRRTGCACTGRFIFAKLLFLKDFDEFTAVGLWHCHASTIDLLQKSETGNRKRRKVGKN